tara:strand:+ start:122 stop:526 length:405 start_codon:yes stop_codon:yes gene_type:complete
LSEIRVTTVSDTAGTGPVTLTKQHAAKAWVNFNGGGTIAARDSFNVSSLTDHTTGQYSTNFANSMANANYSLPAQCSYDITGSTPTNYTALTVKQASGESTTSACRVNTAYATTAGGGLRDMEITCLSILGDLA